MDKSLIRSASKKLSLLDIILHKSNFSQSEDFEPLVFSGGFSQQSLIDYSAVELAFNGESDHQKILRVFVELGVRAIPKKEESEEETNSETNKNLEPLFTVEATYRAEYIIIKELSNEEVKEFTQYNAVHNIWPFWRMHVFSTLKQANLPTLNIPLTRIDQIQKRKKN